VKIHLRYLLGFLFLILLFLKAGGVTAQGFMGLKPLNDTIPDEKNGFFLLPLLYYTPDTRLAYGAAGVYYFKVPPKSEADLPTRISYVQLLGDYTQNKQLDLWGQWNIFTRNEDFLLKGDVRYRDFPDRFYGVGNNTPEGNEEKYAYELFSIKALALKKWRPNFFAGLDYSYTREYNFSYEEGKLLESGTVPGFAGGTGSALGLVAVFDSRDNVVNAYKGRFAEFSSYFYRPFLGSTFNFSNINLSYQSYKAIKPGHVLAFQTVFRWNFGEVPFLDMATAGGDILLRGYARNRFRDRHFWGTQVEYRYPVWWRFGLVHFAGLGDVYNRPSDIGFNTLKYSIGTGIRFVVNPAERLNIRLDYGYGREGGQFYLMVTESF
jgi:hypothetical protein